MGDLGTRLEIEDAWYGWISFKHYFNLKSLAENILPRLGNSKDVLSRLLLSSNVPVGFQPLQLWSLLRVQLLG